MRLFFLTLLLAITTSCVSHTTYEGDGDESYCTWNGMRVPCSWITD